MFSTSCHWSMPERVVAIGDLHGNREALWALLRWAEVLDGQGRWIGGPCTVILLGDVIGRGGHPRSIYLDIRRLMRMAQESGGRLEFLLGNHEAMAMHGIHNYNTIQEYRDFAPRTRNGLSNRLSDDLEALPLDKIPELDLDKLQSEPLGWIEFRRAMHPTGMVGRWLVRRPSLLAVGKILFVHGGLHPSLADVPLEALNEGIATQMARHGSYFSLDPKSPAVSEQGPHWYRIGFRRPDEEVAAEVSSTLAQVGLERMVVGHTPTFLHHPRLVGRILSRAGGRLICADVGIGHCYGGQLACLEILADGTTWSVGPSGRQKL